MTFFHEDLNGWELELRDLRQAVEFAKEALAAEEEREDEQDRLVNVLMQAQVQLALKVVREPSGQTQAELDSARERWRGASEELRQTRRRVAELRAALVAAQRQLEAMPPRPVAPLPPVKLDSCGQARPIRYS